MRTKVALFAFISMSFMNAQDAVLNQGVAAFKSGNYQQAVDLFRQAVADHPNDVNPHLYLGTANMALWVPGGAAADNVERAQSAETEFKRVLELDANNKTALASLASLAYNSAGPLPPEQKTAKLDEAADWYKRLAAIDPVDKTAPYSIGVIAWAKWYPALMTARAAQRLKPEDPGPLASPAREELRAKFASIIDEGIANLDLALKIDPNYDDAMAYMNLLIRERADLSDTKEEYAAGIASADEWVRRTLEAKKNAQSQSGFAAAAPPPPPAPAPPPSGGGGGSRVPPAQTAGSQSPQRIRVSGLVQEANLIKKVDAVYPPLAVQARIEGAVRFTVIIGKDGKLLNVQLVSGHPLLVAAARDAVMGYEYRPALLNNVPVEVITQVDVKFALGN